MKNIVTLLYLGVGLILSAQTTDYNAQKGYVAEGYDVVAYFSNAAKEGSKKFVASHDNAKYKFSSQQNLDTFNENPSKYIPQYGGYCAYAVAVKAKKVAIDPETFEIRDGKLYLFYNAWGTNTFESWKKESPESLVLTADKNWEKIN